MVSPRIRFPSPQHAGSMSVIPCRPGIWAISVTTWAPSWPAPAAVTVCSRSAGTRGLPMLLTVKSAPGCPSRAAVRGPERIGRFPLFVLILGGRAAGSPDWHAAPGGDTLVPDRRGPRGRPAAHRPRPARPLDPTRRTAARQAHREAVVLLPAAARSRRAEGRPHARAHRAGRAQSEFGESSGRQLPFVHNSHFLQREIIHLLSTVFSSPRISVLPPPRSRGSLCPKSAHFLRVYAQ